MTSSASGDSVHRRDANQSIPNYLTALKRHHPNPSRFESSGILLIPYQKLIFRLE